MFSYLIDKAKHILFTLKFSILTLFIILMLVTTFTIMMVRTIIFDQELTYTALTLMKHVSQEVSKELVTGMRPIEVNSEFTAELIKHGLIKTDPDDLISYTYYIAKTMPLVEGAFWSDENGNFIAAFKELDGSISSEYINRNRIPTQHTIILRDADEKIIKKTTTIGDVAYDPRQRPWYKKAKEQKHIISTGVYPFVRHPFTGLTIATPLLNQKQQLNGVFGFDVTTNYLSEFINGQKISPNGFSFIITKNKQLIAYPKRPPFTKVVVKPKELITVDEKTFPIINFTLDLYNKTGKNETLVKWNGKKYLVTYQPEEGLHQRGWLIGVITPESDFIGVLQKINWIVLIFCLLILLLGILIVSDLVSRVVRPINALVKETEKIKRFELRGDISIPSRIKEVVNLRDAIRSMKIGLKQFQRYVPKILVRQLIESGKDIGVGGERKELAVLFTDIQNFTSVAEQTEPNQLLSQVCEYFEELSQIIIGNKGTIDKYIGDSIMAFWGAPLHYNHPTERAARAALECQARLENLNAKWEEEGRIRLPTRIGIHIGDAIVGNLGSSERLNYTAIGDTINICKGIEESNKIYHTQIMVSEDVYHKIKDKFALRKIDCVTFEGKTEAICIYELLAENISALPFDLNAYNECFDKGFNAYNDKRFEEAIAYFRNCLAIYPDDTIAHIYIERCKEHIIKN